MVLNQDHPRCRRTGPPGRRGFYHMRWGKKQAFPHPLTIRITRQMTRIFLDWNATAPLRPEARAAALGALDCTGNPSSVHAEGRKARNLVETARERVAALVGAAAKNVVFTSGGTEANVLALTPGIDVDADRLPRQRLLVSAVEHASVQAGGRFPPLDVEE